MRPIPFIEAETRFAVLVVKCAVYRKRAASLVEFQQEQAVIIAVTRDDEALCPRIPSCCRLVLRLRWYREHHHNQCDSMRDA
jgi:hypothetical protein